MPTCQTLPGLKVDHGYWSDSTWTRWFRIRIHFYLYEKLRFKTSLKMFYFNILSFFSSWEELLLAVQCYFIWYDNHRLCLFAGMHISEPENPNPDEFEYAGSGSDNCGSVCTQHLSGFTNSMIAFRSRPSDVAGGGCSHTLVNVPYILIHDKKNKRSWSDWLVNY
jgi:hypothetical protein